MTSVSAVIPAYNEEHAIGTTVEAMVAAFHGLIDDYEIVVVNDGSTDGTAEVVRSLAAAHARVRTVAHQENRGYGAALATGFAAATRDLIFLTDGDRQFDVRELREFLPLLEVADLAIGYRAPRADPMIRRLYGWGWNVLVNTLFGYTARDVDCAFKLFPRRIIAELNVHSTGHTFSPELLIKARRAGYRVAERRVTHLPRVAGSPKGARPDAIIRAMFELVKLRVEVASTRQTAVTAATE
ncbi:MAG: glycosyltransferase family 2 protein [Chloroflexota bacterium]